MNCLIRKPIHTSIPLTIGLELAWKMRFWMLILEVDLETVLKSIQVSQVDLGSHLEILLDIRQIFDQTLFGFTAQSSAIIDVWTLQYYA